MKTLSLDGPAMIIGLNISGAGTAAANGYYPLTSNRVLGRQAFAKEDASGWQVAYTIAPPDTWLILDPSFLPMYEVQKDSPVPPSGGWSRVLGANPAPTIEYVYTDDSYRDLHLDTAGNLALATRSDGLRQKLETRLKLYRGEWFLNSGAGVPYIERILGRAQPNKDLIGSISQILDIEVLKEQEVLSILSSAAVFDEQSRTFTYTAELQTIYGELTLEGI